MRQGAAHNGLRFFLPEYGNKEAAEALCFLTNGTFLLILLNVYYTCGSVPMEKRFLIKNNIGKRQSEAM